MTEQSKCSIQFFSVQFMSHRPQPSVTIIYQQSGIIHRKLLIKSSDLIFNLVIQSLALNQRFIHDLNQRFIHDLKYKKCNHDKPADNITRDEWEKLHEKFIGIIDILSLLGVGEEHTKKVIDCNAFLRLFSHHSKPNESLTFWLNLIRRIEINSKQSTKNGNIIDDLFSMKKEEEIECDNCLNGFDEIVSKPLILTVSKNVFFFPFFIVHFLKSI